MARREALVWTFSAAAQELGIDRHLLPAIVRTLGIATVKVPTNGRAKGLSSRDIRRIRQSLQTQVS